MERTLCLLKRVGVAAGCRHDSRQDGGATTLRTTNHEPRTFFIFDSSITISPEAPCEHSASAKKNSRSNKNSIGNLVLHSNSKKERLTSDDLEELIPEILEIDRLTHFVASNNKLSNISFLTEFKHLKRLGLGGNEVNEKETTNPREPTRIRTANNRI